MPWSAGSRVEERWLVRRYLGSGSGGELYEVLDRELGRPVALRRLPTARGERIRGRARKLEHWHRPRLATCLEVHEGESGVLVIRERVAGLPWRQLIGSGEPLPEDVLIGLLGELCRGLAELHAAGWVHGHLGIGDLLVRPEGSVVITDLEIGAAAPPDADSAPEVHEGGEAGVAADVWAVGVLACRALGQPPPGPASPHLPLDGVGAALAALVRRCLELMPEDRYRSVEEITADLEGIG